MFLGIEIVIKKKFDGLVKNSTSLQDRKITMRYDKMGKEENYTLYCQLRVVRETYSL